MRDCRQRSENRADESLISAWRCESRFVVVKRRLALNGLCRGLRYRMAGENRVAIGSRMRVRLMLIVLPLLLGGWFDDPPAWARPGGRPIDPVLFQRERSICRGQASVYAGREGMWIVTFRE